MAVAVESRKAPVGNTGVASLDCEREVAVVRRAASVSMDNRDTRHH